MVSSFSPSHRFFVSLCLHPFLLSSFQILCLLTVLLPRISACADHWLATGLKSVTTQPQGLCAFVPPALLVAIFCVSLFKLPRASDRLSWPLRTQHFNYNGFLLQRVRSPTPIQSAMAGEEDHLISCSNHSATKWVVALRQCVGWNEAMKHGKKPFEL